MKPSLRRSIKSGQVGLRELNITIDGATSAGTVTIAGFDRYQMEASTYNGVGDYTLNFKYAFERDCQLKGFAGIIADSTLYVHTVSENSIRVVSTDLAGAAQEGDFHLCIIGSDNRFDV